jgi:hypothetical protein
MRPTKQNLGTNEQHKQRNIYIWDLFENGFVVEGVEDISGVEEGDAGVDSVVDESDYVFFGIGIGIEDGHVDATQALRSPTPPVPVNPALFSRLLLPPFLYTNNTGQQQLKPKSSD